MQALHNLMQETSLFQGTISFTHARISSVILCRGAITGWTCSSIHSWTVALGNRHVISSLKASTFCCNVVRILRSRVIFVKQFPRRCYKSAPVMSLVSPWGFAVNLHGDEWRYQLPPPVVWAEPSSHEPTVPHEKVKLRICVVRSHKPHSRRVFNV